MARHSAALQEPYCRCYGELASAFRHGPTQVLWFGKVMRGDYERNHEWNIPGCLERALRAASLDNSSHDAKPAGRGSKAKARVGDELDRHAVRPHSTWFVRHGRQSTRRARTPC